MLVIGLRFRIVGLGEVIGLRVAAGDGPLVITRVDLLIPHGSVTARKVVLQVSSLAVRNAAVELLAVLRVPSEAIFLAQSSGVLQILSSGLGSWLWFLLLLILWLLLQLLLLRLLLGLVLDRIIILHGIAQLSAFTAIRIPRVDASGSLGVVNCSADAFKPESRGLRISLVHASVKDSAVTVVRIVAVAGTFVGSGHTPLKSCMVEKKMERLESYFNV